MAKSNRERVGEIMDALKRGLGPFILLQYKYIYKSKYLQEMELKLYSQQHSVHLPDEEAALKEIDMQGWLRLMFHNWREVFRDKLGHNERSYVSEMMIARTTLAGLKPWCMVIQPHPDVRDGEFTKAEFAADLTKVLRGEAAPEYGFAAEFFRCTYLTEGLRDLIINGIKRLTGEGAIRSCS